MKFSSVLAAVALAVTASAAAIGNNNGLVLERANLQDIVTFDKHSVKVRGERLYIFSAEVHPYRIPVPGFWLDILQKIKALGFNTVSFYVHWALLEGEPGVYRADGVFAFEPFFEAAAKAGIYLIARPGPYINAECSGGGFPAWLQRLKGQSRTRAPDYLKATDNYIAHIGKAIAKAQITNGGPVILVQPENEYSGGTDDVPGGFPDPVYFSYVKNQLYEAGIVVPLISNDAWTHGYFAPGWSKDGTPAGSIGNVDIYGYNNYPNGFDCANPDRWTNPLTTDYAATHERLSPTTPHTVPELQGGAFDPWGGAGFEMCSALLNHEFERVFYKNMFAAHTTVMNLYMTFGGTNWGNLGHADGYTSYDYGAAINEKRQVTREKYSELKLEGQFLKVSPAFLTAKANTASNGTFASTVDIFTTPLLGTEQPSNFYIVRHADWQRITPTSYKFNFKTSEGTITVPQLDGSLTLTRRDSKWHVADYDLGGINLLYSSAEIFTWKKYSDKTVLVVYGGASEQHELAVKSSSAAKVIEGSDVMTKSANGTTILNWKVSSTRRVVQIGSLFVYLLDRNTAYNYWVPDFARTDAWGAYAAGINNTASVIVEAGYLVRSVYINGPALHIDADFNATTTIKVIGAPSNVRSLHINSNKLPFTKDAVTGDWSSTQPYTAPKIELPDLSALTWKYVDDLPELQASYDDSLWTKADNKTTNNPISPLRTPTSLLAADYGYSNGVILLRGKFVANGKESNVSLWTQGGSAFGSSVWIGSEYVGSWTGDNANREQNNTYTLPKLTAGKSYTFTVVVDNNGLDGNWFVGAEFQKNPRGILGYSLEGHPQSDISWKITGNYKGEQYPDKARGPLNEGGLFAERQGFHLPYPPNRLWAAGSPYTGISKAGIAFYQTSFKLDLPRNYDIPLEFTFGKTIIDGKTANMRVQLYVNGYQFGKYVNNIGPQSRFPVPQGILKYHGTNWITLEVWAQQASGARVTDFKLSSGTPVWTSLKEPIQPAAPDWRKREGAF